VTFDRQLGGTHRLSRFSSLPAHFRHNVRRFRFEIAKTEGAASQSRLDSNHFVSAARLIHRWHQSCQRYFTKIFNQNHIKT
jgi:hypothetical protein